MVFGTIDSLELESCGIYKPYVWGMHNYTFDCR
jgi:hypothetical protein